MTADDTELYETSLDDEVEALRFKLQEALEALNKPCAPCRIARRELPCDPDCNLYNIRIALLGNGAEPKGGKQC